MPMTDESLQDPTYGSHIVLSNIGDAVVVADARGNPPLEDGQFNHPKTVADHAMADHP